MNRERTLGMSSKKKISKAFSATRSLGIPDDQIKPILRDLLKMYDGNWKLIEEDNYRTLLDAYFEHKENEVPISCFFFAVKMYI